MKLEDTGADFAFLQSLPGQKWLLKGNHDYWWTTARKMERYLAERGLDTLHILHNNCVRLGQTALCGTRGWPFDELQAQSAKIMAREAGRLQMSLEAAGDCAEKIAFCTIRRFSVTPVQPICWLCCTRTACAAATTGTCTARPSGTRCRVCATASNIS